MTEAHLRIDDSLLEGIAGLLGLDAVRALEQLQLDEASKERLEFLARKANEGKLTKSETEEYDRYIEIRDIIGTLCLKAKNIGQMNADARERLRNFAQFAQEMMQDSADDVDEAEYDDEEYIDEMDLADIPERLQELEIAIAGIEIVIARHDNDIAILRAFYDGLHLGRIERNPNQPDGS